MVFIIIMDLIITLKSTSIPAKGTVEHIFKAVVHLFCA